MTLEPRDHNQGVRAEWAQGEVKGGGSLGEGGQQGLWKSLLDLDSS